MTYTCWRGTIPEKTHTLIMHTLDPLIIAHDDRWDLPLPSLQDTLTYIQNVQKNIIACLADGDDPVRDYLALYAVFHHDMHNEAYTYTRSPDPELSVTGNCQSRLSVTQRWRVNG